MSSTLIRLLLFILIVKNIQLKVIEVKLGDKIESCCSIQLKKGEALVIFGYSFRLYTLVETVLIEGDMPSFKQKYSDFTVEKQGETMCLTKQSAGTSDDKLSVKCEARESNGLGKATATEINEIRVYEPVQFKETPPETLNVLVGEQASVTCSATGSPDLLVQWHSQAQRNITTGSPTATLVLASVDSQMNGNKYTCEASTTIPENKSQSLLTKILTLNVQFKPELDIKTFVVHTDLDIEETVNITVSGNPIPNLNCQMQEVKANVIASESSPNPFKYVYKMVINKVTQQNIGNYSCNASNILGSVSKVIKLSLNPENLKVIQSINKQYSDCYFLTWTMNSKSPIQRVVIDVATGETDPVLKTVTLTDIDVKKYEKVSGTRENNWEMKFTYPLTNISSESLHKISLKVCNKHECIELKNAVEVKTPTADENNKCDINSRFFDTENPGSKTIDLNPSFQFIVIQAIVMLFMPLALQQIY